MNPHLTMLQNTNCVLNFNYYYGKVVGQYLKTTFSVKKKEKLEIELKRREEEDREVLLQKKRLEFLMT